MMKMLCSLERRPSIAKMEPKESICRSLRLVGKRIRSIKELSLISPHRGAQDIVLNESVSTETDERRRFVFDRPALGQYRVRLETRELRKH